MQFIKDISFSAFWTFIILCFIGIIIGCSNNTPNKPEPKTVTVEGGWNDGNYQIFIIKDYRQNLQWDAINFSHSLVIIPNTQKPIKSEKE